MRRSIASGKIMVAVCAGLLTTGSASASDWLIRTYSDPPAQITNYATADQLIGGFKLKTGFPVSSTYSLTNVQDNNDGSGVAGLPTGTQIVGLPAGDNDDFAFVGTGSATVGIGGSYVFTNNTDDGSRLKAGLNGGPLNQVITDDVLSGGHDVSSPAFTLNEGDKINFDWMWFERGGGAHGNITYSRNGGTRVAVGDSSQGLSLDGGAFTGKVYKSDVGGTALGPSVNGEYRGLAFAKTMTANPNFLKGSADLNTFNITGNGGTGFYGGDAFPPGLPAGDNNNYVVNGTGFLKVVTEGDYRFGSLSDDGAEMLLKSPDGNTILASISDDTFHGAGFPGDVKTSSAVHLTPGLYPISYLYFEAGGGDTGELFLINPNYAGADNAITADQLIALVGDTAAGGLEVVQVPEPTTLSLLAIGALGLIRRRNRR
jgi:hypothetical protein